MNQSRRDKAVSVGGSLFQKASLLARSCCSGTSAVRSLPGVNRTWTEGPDAVAIDPKQSLPRPAELIRVVRLSIHSAGRQWDRGSNLSRARAF